MHIRVPFLLLTFVGFAGIPTACGLGIWFGVDLGRVEACHATCIDAGMYPPPTSSTAYICECVLSEDVDTGR